MAAITGRVTVEPVARPNIVTGSVDKTAGKERGDQGQMRPKPKRPARRAALAWQRTAAYPVLSLLATTVLSQEPPGSVNPAGLASRSPEEVEREAFALDYGYGGVTDSSRARSLFEQAAAAGRPASIAALAKLYWFGEGGPQDQERALALYLQAADLGVADAQAFLGYIYQFGQGVDADDEAARRWFEAAASQGDPRAIRGLAEMYLAGRGMPANTDLGFELLERAAELDEPLATRAVASRLLRDDSEREVQRGLLMLERIADSDPDAAYQLGWAHLTGIGVPRNFEEAARWLRRAMSDGHPFAALVFARMVEDGLGVPADPRLAESMRTQVFEKASPNEKNNLAWTLSVHPHPLARDGPLAVSVMENLLASPELASPARLDTLAAAYAEAGRFEEAVATQERVIEALRAAAEQDTGRQERSGDGLAVASERLELYRAGNVYRSGD